MIYSIWATARQDLTPIPLSFPKHRKI